MTNLILKASVMAFAQSSNEIMVEIRDLRGLAINDNVMDGSSDASHYS